MSDPLSEPRRFSISLPRPLWFGLATVVLAMAYGGLYWHNLRTGPCMGDERTGIKYFLDYERAFAHARIWDKPVFVYFTGVNCVNSRRMEKTVLRAPAVVERLRKFICVEAFVDNVPLVPDRTEAARLLSENVKLQEESFGDVTLPAFVVLDPDFDLPRNTERRDPLAQTSGLVEDEGIFIRFLDEALEKWSTSRSSARPSLPASAGH